MHLIIVVLHVSSNIVEGRIYFSSKAYQVIDQRRSTYQYACYPMPCLTGGFSMLEKGAATLNKDAEVGAGEGGVGVVLDLDLALRVEQEQHWLREGLVRLPVAARVADEEAPFLRSCTSFWKVDTAQGHVVRMVLEYS